MSIQKLSRNFQTFDILQSIHIFKYSTRTGGFGNRRNDTVEELKKVEEEVQKKEEAKKAALAEVDEAYAEAVKAWNHYLEVSKKHEQKKAYLPDDSFKTLLDILFK